MENMEKKDAGLPAGKKKRKIPWSMLYILATVVAVLLFGLFNQQFGNVFHTISNLTPGFLSLGVLISLVYFLFEGEIFRLLLRSQGYRISVVEGLKNALLGLYYSYITPSSTGGQPMQSAYLLRDSKIPAGISTAVLIVKFMCFQCAFVLVSVVSFIGMYGNLAANNPTIIPFIVLGLVINGCSILFFASLSTAATPIAHTVTTMALSLYENDAGVPVNFVSYTIFGVAACLVTFAASMVLTKFVCRPGTERLSSLDSSVLKSETTPMSRQEKYTLLVFVLVVAMWLLPGIIAPVLPEVASAISSLGTPTPAMIGACLLCVLHVGESL